MRMNRSMPVIITLCSYSPCLLAGQNGRPLAADAPTRPPSGGGIRQSNVLARKLELGGIKTSRSTDTKPTPVRESASEQARYSSSIAKMRTQFAQEANALGLEVDAAPKTARVDDKVQRVSLTAVSPSWLTRDSQAFFMEHSLFVLETPDLHKTTVASTTLVFARHGDQITSTFITRFPRSLGTSAYSDTGRSFVIRHESVFSFDDLDALIHQRNTGRPDRTPADTLSSITHITESITLNDGFGHQLTYDPHLVTLEDALAQLGTGCTSCFWDCLAENQIFITAPVLACLTVAFIGCASACWVCGPCCTACLAGPAAICGLAATPGAVATIGECGVACWSGPDPDEIEDCNGTCAPIAWIGDGVCDDGSAAFNFACDAFECDGGDCNCCPPGEIGDCNGICGPESWVGDGICDDGSGNWNFNCEALDNDGGDCSTGACCLADGNCVAVTDFDCTSSFVGAYRGDDTTCATANCGSRCASECDWCWTETPVDNSCPNEWNGTSDGCDCGCQFDDPDCGTPPEGGVCCDPNLASTQCSEDVPRDDCLETGGAYVGDGVSCSQADCQGRCDQLGLPCAYCWLGSGFENNCPGEWLGTNDGCDCGCQFDDGDCGGVTGACCQSDGSCAIASGASACTGMGGTYRGDGTDCEANLCPDGCDQAPYTIGGDVFKDCDDPENSGVLFQRVDVACEKGFNESTTTTSSQGRWSMSGVPCDTCIVTVEATCFQDAICPPSRCSNSADIVVNDANRASNQDLSFFFDVVMSGWVVPDPMLADSSLRTGVYVHLTTNDGSNIQNQQVRFIRRYWAERIENGVIYGPTDDLSVGGPSRNLPSGGFPTGSGLSNVLTTTTDSTGVAHAEFVPPDWTDYIADDPNHRIVVWYNVDGGGNPYTQIDFPMVQCTSDPDCDDGVFCNGAEACDGGLCSHSNEADGTSCDDGDPCTVNDSCSGGICGGVASSDPCCGSSDPCCGVDCSDGDSCTTDTCDPADGSCSHEKVECSGKQVCDPDTGDCVDCLADADCDDKNPCTDNICGTDLTCTFPPNDDLSCDDGDACNGSEFCKDGECVDGQPLNCDDGEFCNGQETCSDGGCVAGEPVCDPDQTCLEDDDVCVRECVSDADCLGRMQCLGSQCTRFLVSPIGPGDPEPPQPLQPTCATNDDCSTETPTCVDGYCLRPCSGDHDCPSDEVCESSYCWPVCEDDGYCPDATFCFDGRCTPNCENCNDGLFCNGIEQCVDGVCDIGNPPCTASEVCDEDQDCCLVWIPPTPCGACGDGAWVCIFLGPFLWLGMRFAGRGQRRSRRV